MAARRLIAILLVLLFLSSLAAALAPVSQTGKSASSSTTDTSTDAAASPTLPPETSGEAPTLINQSIDTALEKPPLIRASIGDQLQLKVTSQETGTVELVHIGPTEDVGPQQPALFDVLLRDPGTYPVRFLETGREIAKIVVTATQPEAPRAR